MHTAERYPTQPVMAENRSQISQIFYESTLISCFQIKYGRKIIQHELELNLLIRGSASLVPDKNIHLSGEISLSTWLPMIDSINLAFRGQKYAAILIKSLTYNLTCLIFNSLTCVT